MRRVFGGYGSSDAPIENCYWAETVSHSELECAPLCGGLQVDVAIIGAGFTGLNAALTLAEAGVSVAVVDARYPGWGATGRNGGFCCLGGAKAGDGQLDKSHGKAARLEYRGAERAAVEHVAALLERHGIDAQTHSHGETVLAHKAGVRFEGEARAIEENYGVLPELHEDLPALGMAGGFHRGMTVPIGFALNPRRYLKGLLEAASAAGARIYGNSSIVAHRSGNKHQLSTPEGSIVAQSLLVATNGYSSEDMPAWMAARYMPAQSSVIVTRELSEAELEAGWSSAQMAYDSRTLLHYFRLLPNRRFLFGMRGGLSVSARSDGRIARQIRRDFERLFPFWRHVETPHFWSGMVCLSASLTPFCGAINGNTFAAFGYHGNGVAMGSYAGNLVARQILQREHETPEIMLKDPRRFPLGRARRALLYPAYGYAGLKDRFLI